MSAFLVDADVIIEGLKGRVATLSMLAHFALGELAVTWPTVGEVYAGAIGSPNPDAHLDVMRGFLEPYARIAFGDDVMRRFGELRHFLRRRGSVISDMDLLVAATALAYDLTLLTYNRRHFDRVPELRVYLAR